MQDKDSSSNAINWSEYNASFVKRGDITLWINAEDLKNSVRPDEKRPRGRPKSYTNALIRAILIVRTLYRFPLRQTMGLARSFFPKLGCDASLPILSREVV